VDCSHLRTARVVVWWGHTDGPVWGAPPGSDVPMSAEQSVEMLKDMRSEVSTMTMIDVHAHFLSDFYRMPFSWRVCARRTG